MDNIYVTLQKTFIVNSSQSQGKMLVGDLEDPNGSTIPVMGFLLDPAAETAMKDVQELIPTSRCYIRPDWVQNGLAISRRATPWNAYTHLINNVAVPLDVPLRQPSAKPRRVWTTSSKVNDMIRELLSFFSDLHDQGFALGNFQPDDFVVVENDHVPKLWRTELVRGTHFEKFRRRNFVHLARFLKEYLKLHFPMSSEHPDLPSHTKNFLHMLMRLGGETTTGKLKEDVEYLKVHVQVLGFGRTIHAFKSILDWSKGLLASDPGNSMREEWLRFLDQEFGEYTALVRGRANRFKSSWLVSIEADQHTLINTIFESSKWGVYSNDAKDLLRCLRNFMAHLTDHKGHHDIDATKLYIIIEDKFPGLIWKFFSAIQNYDKLRLRSRMEFSN